MPSEEGAAITRQRWVSGSTRIACTTRAGHLIARRSGDNAAQASMFYVGYTADEQNAATRPVTFFFNGGPGSATLLRPRETRTGPRRHPRKRARGPLDEVQPRRQGSTVTEQPGLR